MAIELPSNKVDENIVSDDNIAAAMGIDLAESNTEVIFYE
jgi:hypothetical protein